MNSTLPDSCVLRQATSQDLWSIRKLVFSALLDPTQLHWSQFWVIEYQGQVIACGQLREFPQAQELGSLVVSKNWRDRGLGSYLVQHLITTATKPIYLECLGSRRVNFYSRFGFVPISWQELPPSLKPKFTVSHLAHNILKMQFYIMYYSLPSP